MAKSDGAWVRIRKFEEYKGRKDVTHNSWFRCSNRLLEDPDFYAFSSQELLVWIYILSLASQKDSGVVFVNFNHADRVCRLPKKCVLSALEKLYTFQIDPADVTETLRVRDADVTETCATDITNRQTDITSLAEKVEDGNLDPIGLATLWNEYANQCRPLIGTKKSLPKVDLKSFFPDRPRYKKASKLCSQLPAEGYWRSVVERICQSDFCRGKNNRSWLADFDFLVNDETHVKALEGKYDSRSGKTAVGPL
jgi:hypothetical protein